ncbi:pentatricopeptide repeat-containing protein At5g27460 [Actinidia eriantha]|uniref:pentatricopeptide repeat-containing protein At5g27460 n=1 Tax=Actinidia eriantha TaxID=165200 RepID=UPI00258F9192|nr:pentatricopeptide repeat-containing protein At5g27460 [Actinidia eriantha]
MAMVTLLRNHGRINTSHTGIWWRPISSRASPIDVAGESSPPSNKGYRNDELKRRIFRLGLTRRSATAVLENWVGEGHRVSISELRHIATHLVKFRRYKHALEIFTWMEDCNGYLISAAEHAIRLELIIKVHNLKQGEEYFASITDTTSRKAACLTLLHSYVKERATEKAEALMLKMNSLGLIVSPHPFNEMMKLYMATSQFQKVLTAILQMKQNNIPRSVLSYNLWMDACSEVSGVASAEMVYKEMVNDKDVELGWSTLATLANIYLKSGFVSKATLALQNAEKKLSSTNRLGYFFLITLYTSLNNKDGVFRLWEACKAVEGNITCSNYMCILSCLVKLGDIEEAEKIFVEYESQCRKYDVRVSNILLGAYMRNGLMEKAETLHLHTLKRGGCPNYKTWEILMEGWVRNQNMDKAVNAMKKGFSVLKHCDWRPSPSIVVAIAEFFEKSENIEEAKRYLKVVRRLGLASLPVYKSLLRTHASAQQSTQEIFEMMKKDEIDLDDETSAHLQTFAA